MGEAGQGGEGVQTGWVEELDLNQLHPGHLVPDHLQPWPQLDHVEHVDGRNLQSEVLELFEDLERLQALVDGLRVACLKHVVDDCGRGDVGDDGNDVFDLR